MGYHRFSAAILVGLLIFTGIAQGRLIDKWGFRLGGGEVVGDNAGRSVQYDYGSGAIAGINSSILISTKLNLWFELKGEWRYMTWGRKGCSYCGYPGVPRDKIEVQEFAPGISLLHHARFLPKIGTHPFIQIGIEHNWLELQKSPETYDYRHWNSRSWSWFAGGGISIPIDDIELLFSVRYNEDLTDNVDPNYECAPLGSRFSEVHYLVGVNFDLRNE